MKSKYLLLSLVLISTRIFAANYHQTTKDITVLKSESKGRIIPATENSSYWGRDRTIFVDIKKCQVLAEEDYEGHSAQYYDEYKKLTVDCKEAIEEISGLPLITHANFSNVHKRVSGTNEEANVSYISENFNCRMVEITTATRQEAFSYNTSIGFYTNNIHNEKDEIAFVSVPPYELKKFGEAKNHSGQKLVLHKFWAIAYCWAGSMTSSGSQSFQFKPFLKYHHGDDAYYNWDDVRENYYISLSNENFDREHEVVVPGSIVEVDRPYTLIVEL